jgi:glutamate-1-semialdehyde 2,1-aminomutase
VAKGTCYTFPVEDSVILAEEIKRRFGCDLVRFSNSGTEATMDAIRVARGFTGREKIVKFEGGYHGHHDDVLVSIQPPRELIGPMEAPLTVPASAGLPASRIAETVVAPYNNPEALRDPRPPRREIAAIIIEPAVQHRRRAAPGSRERPRAGHAHGCVLIFDEVKTGSLAYGGATEWFGVKPDLFCLAKSSAAGAMAPWRPRRGDERDRAAARVAPGRGAAGTALSTRPSRGATRVAHLARSTATAVDGRRRGRADRDPDARRLSRLQAMGDRLTAGSQVVDEFGLPGYAVNVGPRAASCSRRRVTNYRDFTGLDSELWAASFFYLANRGILLPPGPDDQWTLSVQHSDAEVDRYVATFREFARELTA